MKKILLLGGTGTISYSVMHRALEKGFDVSVLNRGKRGKKLPQSVTSIICDLKDDEKLKTVISNTSFDVIVDFFSRNPSDIERLYSVLAKNWDGVICKHPQMRKKPCMDGSRSEHSETG